MTDESVDEYLMVWDALGEMMIVMTTDEPQLDTAMSEYLNTGRDSLLHLTLWDGDSVRTRTSGVSAWTISTSAGRRRAMELEAARLSERAENRKLAGMWDDE